MKKTIFFLTFCFLVGIYLWQGIYLAKDYNSIENTSFLIEKGENSFDIAEDLNNKGLIKNEFLFNSFVLFSNNSKKLQAGEYSLSPNMSISNIVKKITSGETIKQAITILEGWNLRDIAWYFENKGMFQAEELFELVGFPLIDYSDNNELLKLKDFSKEYDFLNDKNENISLEGYLFPDTYEINKNSEIGDIVSLMLDNFNKKLTKDLREEIKNQENTIFEIITMASLIEKEVSIEKDRRLVSGVLWKRFKVGMPLQVDASIIYITQKTDTKVFKKDTQIDSLYNTYKYRGLPLGPICNPGINSIKAAIYPESNEYWYYLSTSEGETIFSKTLEEHNIAKAKYIK